MANRMKTPSSKSPAHSSSSARQAPASTRQRPVKASGLAISKKKPLRGKTGVSKPSASGSRSSKQAASKSVIASNARSDSSDHLAIKVQDTMELPTLDHNRIIKKYPNRRLYDTLFSSYVTLSDIKDLVMSQELFHVVDAKTGEDITRSILMQVILEEETHGQPLFSTQSLLQMIRFYGNSLQGMMAPFLEKNLNQFSDLQNQYLSHCQKLGGLSSLENWLSFMNHQSNIELANPMSMFFESGTQFLEKMKVQSEGILSNFPFKPPVK